MLSAMVDGNYDVFKAYWKAEDYKYDDWAKGKQLAEETKAVAEQVATTKETDSRDYIWTCRCCRSPDDGG